MTFVNKTFDELTTVELYELLKVRAEVFVVEQNCVYQDLDDRDYVSRHLFYQDEEGHVHAYLRLFPRDNEEGTIQMGRVLTLHHGRGLGGKLLQDSLAAAEAMGAKEMFLEAQTYAIGFYERVGFAVCSDEFLEDGIPHVQMRRAM